MATISFNGLEKCVEITFGSGEDSANIEVIDIYSLWKEWTQIDDNLKWDQAFSSTGGDPLGGTEYLGSAFFIKNDWKICPIPYTGIQATKLVLVGNLFPEIVGTPLFDYSSVPINQQTHCELRTSNLPILQVIETGVSGLTPEESAALLKIKSNAGLIPALL
jgi:hypothetical protein